MISWIQQRLIKNGKWIFSILLIIVIVAFVFVIGNTPGIPGAERGLARVDFYGVNLADRTELEAMDRATALGIFLDTGNGQVTGEIIRQVALSRAALLYLADAYQIPPPTADSIREYLSTRPVFLDQEGEFDPDAYQRFFDNIKTNPMYPAAVVDQIVSDQYRLDQVSQLIQGLGYTTDHEQLLQSQRELTEWSLEVAAYPVAQYRPEVEISDEIIQEYYDVNAFQFETRPQQELSWIYWPSSLANFNIPEPAEDDLLNHLERHISQFMLTPEESAGRESLPEPEELLELKRDDILADWKSTMAAGSTRQTASDFAYKLYEDGVPQNDPSLAQRIEDAGAFSGSFNPVARDTVPTAAGEGATWNILQACRSLNNQQWFTDAIEFREGYAVFYLTGVIAPYIPELPEIRDQVESAYLAAENRRLLDEAGRESAAYIREQLAAGVSFRDAVNHSPISPTFDQQLSNINTAFDSLAGDNFNQNLLEEAQKVGFQFTEYENYSPISTEQGPPMVVFNAIQNLGVGDVSEMTMGSGQSFFVLVRDKVVPEVDIESETYLNTANALAAYSQTLFLRNTTAELIQRGAPEDEVIR